VHRPEHQVPRPRKQLLAPAAFTGYTPWSGSLISCVAALGRPVRLQPVSPSSPNLLLPRAHLRVSLGSLLGDLRAALGLDTAWGLV
jgi:hypothetical protein